MKGFAVGLALKQRQKATRKSPIEYNSRTPFNICYREYGTAPAACFSSTSGLTGSMQGPFEVGGAVDGCWTTGGVDCCADDLITDVA